MAITISIAEKAFDHAAAIERFSSAVGDAGAIVTFSGNVRGEGGSVKALHLEQFPGVTERSIRDIVDKAINRWTLDEVLVIHRVGTMVPGEAIVLVCTASAHRRDAFEAADFLMDYLKTKAYFWKKEVTKSGETWIEPRGVDYADAARWERV